ncbi:unnamed protein product [Protopolystoma xenopodis]|uniref:Uncharacterized protein n=1 Tax=Protopolystoma xenopodis TaxID=117903 RepID=A0A3S5CE84_9PLAT|nr:unnamed protein product [Protopolystoma xenopodis]
MPNYNKPSSHFSQAHQRCEQTDWSSLKWEPEKTVENRFSDCARYQPARSDCRHSGFYVVRASGISGADSEEQLAFNLSKRSRVVRPCRHGRTPQTQRVIIRRSSSLLDKSAQLSVRDTLASPHPTQHHHTPATQDPRLGCSRQTHVS